ncbi:MAG: PaaI family thioesterase [Flavobacteriaceae bacterium]
MEKSEQQLVESCNAMCKNTLMETLGIEFTAISKDTIIARMPVTPKVHQPDGVLHGGASVALAESVGSAGAFIFLGEPNIQIRGIEISANHIKSVKEGYVYAHAQIIHHGKTLQLWHIRIENEAKELVSFIKLTTITLRT